MKTTGCDWRSFKKKKLVRGNSFLVVFINQLLKQTKVRNIWHPQFSKCTTVLLINDQLRLTWLQVYKKSLKVWAVKTLLSSPTPFHQGCREFLPDQNWNEGKILHQWNPNLAHVSKLVVNLHDHLKTKTPHKAYLVFFFHIFNPIWVLKHNLGKQDITLAQWHLLCVCLWEFKG